jgi:hypothetical protein
LQYAEERVDKRLEEYDSDLLGRMCFTNLTRNESLCNGKLLKISLFHSQSVKHAVDIPAGWEAWHFTLIWNLAFAAKAPWRRFVRGAIGPPHPGCAPGEG